MKSFRLFIILISAVLMFQDIYAQKPANEITLIYNISVQSTSEKTELAKSLEGAVLSVYIKGNQSRSDMKSALGTESNLFDSKTGKGFILKEYSGQKLMITMNNANWNQKNQFYHNLKFNISDNEETIAGFKSKKAVAVTPEGKQITVYFTTDLAITNKQYNNAFPQLPGVPVQFELESGSLKFKYTLSRYTYDIIPSAKFDIPKAGYRVMTFEENQQLKKGDRK